MSKIEEFSSMRLICRVFVSRQLHHIQPLIKKSFNNLPVIIYFHYCISSTQGQISGLQEELKEGKLALSKVQTEKKELQGKLNDLEKVFF